MKTNTPRPLALATALLAALPALHAADYTWNLSTGGVWDTTAENWTGDGSTWVNGSGSNAVFNAFASGATISFGTNITAGTLSTNGGSTINFNGGAGTSIDVTRIETAGTSGSSGSIDMFKVLTGNHDFTLHSTAAGSSVAGRLNLKTAANYTGNTYLTGTAYLLIDGSADNILPTGTLLSLASGTTLRLAKGGTQLLTVAGLTGAGTLASQTGTAQQHTLTIQTSSANTGELRFTGALNNSTSTLNLKIDGNGTQIISGADKNYAGATTLSGGTLVLGANLANSSSVTINGGTLASEGVNARKLGAGAVTMTSGEIRPGAWGGVGKFTVAANQDFTVTGGTLYFDLGSGGANTFDQILGSGTGSFSVSSSTLVLNLLSGFDYDNTYAILSGFAGGSVSGLAITGYDTANWLAALSDSGVLSFSAAAVPEPSASAALAGIALLGFAAIRRRRA